MKLDASVMRTMSRQDFRVLEAVEKGMQNHALVPVSLISSISNLRHGGCHKILSSLLRDNLLSHDQSCGYDGYRLTNSGYDILALWNLKCRGYIAALGDCIGTGKESDVYIAATPQGKQIVLKFHRLGRTSFRDVKKKRDYFMMHSMKKNKHGGISISNQDQPNSWLFLSRISALKEYTFMKALYDVGYPTPKPLTHNRHVVSMGLIRGRPLYQIRPNTLSSTQAQSIFEQSMDMCKQLVRNGLVHCDLNEFNLLVDLSGGSQHYNPENEEDDDAAFDQDGNATFAPDGDDVGEHYVRHSGSTASVTGRGMLSVPVGVFDAAHGNQAVSTTIDGAIPMNDSGGGGGNANDNDRSVPAQDNILDYTPQPNVNQDGTEPTPIVTLIDFPQMISIKHPNAQELWERDIECLKRFFTMKLKFNVSQMEWDRLVPKWEDLISAVVEDGDGEGSDDDEDNSDGENDSQDGMKNDNDDDGNKSVFTTTSVTSKSILASKKQLRLDQELLVSGYSKEDSQRDSQLYYFDEANRTGDVEGISPVLEEEDEDNDENDDDGDGDGISDDNGDYNKVEKQSSPQASPTHLHEEEKEILEPAELNNIVLDLNGMKDLTVGGGGAGGLGPKNDEMSLSSKVRSYAHSQAETIARERVRKQLEQQKRFKNQRTAFKKGNKNKTFIKGKRVFKEDYGL